MGVACALSQWKAKLSAIVAALNTEERKHKTHHSKKKARVHRSKQQPLRRILLSATALAAPAAAGVSVLQDALSELQAQLDELVASESRGQRSGRPCLALPELSVAAP
jgi:cobalamin-dependent methionine synthase I